MPETIETGNSWDTDGADGPSMIPQDKLTEILVRLTQLDAGQLHMIEKLAELRNDMNTSREARIKLDARLSAVEWNLAGHERRMRPMRTFWYSVIGAWIVAAGTALMVHFVGWK